MFDIFNFKKKKEKEAKLEEFQINLRENLSKTTSVQEQNLELQKSAMEIAWENHELNEQSNNLFSIIKEQKICFYNVRIKLNQSKMKLTRGKKK